MWMGVHMKLNQPGITHFPDFRPAKHDLIWTVIGNQPFTVAVRIFLLLPATYFSLTNQPCNEKNMCMKVIFLQYRPCPEPVIKITIIKCEHDTLSWKRSPLIKIFKFSGCYSPPVILCEPLHLFTKCFRWECHKPRTTTDMMIHQYGKMPCIQHKKLSSFNHSENILAETTVRSQR